jgi:hypothetical protein
LEVNFLLTYFIWKHPSYTQNHISHAFMSMAFFESWKYEILLILVHDNELTIILEL